ncbi:MAG TPA: hypothetical protein VJK06_06310 [Methyloceanibacter sp.]|nr:hypothetical protein [Methyloceanibacter sp.]
MSKAKSKPKRRAAKPRTGVKRRSPAAASLRDPRYRKRVVKTAKVYNRKRKPAILEDETE